ncbi:MAG: glutaminyl-peptide cyclotransferase [Halarsenatibacteraceae bacterium]
MRNLLAGLSGVLLILLIVFPVSAAEIDYYSYEIVDTYYHDRNAFSQGLYYEAGIIFEGTGRYGESDLRKYRPGEEEIIAWHELPEEFFGEGITLLNNKIYQGTWQEGTVFIYDRDVNLLEERSFPYDVWGFTDNDEELILSDGTSKIRFFDPDTFELLDQIEVSYLGTPIDNINELEYINGEIYGNIWYEDYIIIIDPASGEVTGHIDLTGIINPDDYDYKLNVLNGIAYDQKNDRLFVTGKYWPLIFEITLINESSRPDN